MTLRLGPVRERALLVGLEVRGRAGRTGQSGYSAEESLEELATLVRGAGSVFRVGAEFAASPSLKSVRWLATNAADNGLAERAAGSGMR